MKRYLFPTIIITTVLVMILTALIICLRTDGKSGELKYNGQTVTDQNVTVYRRTAYVPALEVLTAIGADITWLDDEQAVISYKDNKYQLNLSEALLVEENDNFNLIEVPPDAKNYYCKAIDREIILDIETLRVMLELMGEKVMIDISYKDSLVLIQVR